MTPWSFHDDAVTQQWWKTLKLGSLNRVWQKNNQQKLCADTWSNSLNDFREQNSLYQLDWDKVILIIFPDILPFLHLYIMAQSWGINKGQKCSHTTTLPSLKTPNSPGWLPWIKQLEISPVKLTLPISHK